MSLIRYDDYCPTNQKFGRLGDPLGEIVTVSVHKYNIIMSCCDMALQRDLIQEMHCQDIDYFIT